MKDRSPILLLGICFLDISARRNEPKYQIRGRASLFLYIKRPRFGGRIQAQSSGRGGGGGGAPCRRPRERGTESTGSRARLPGEAFSGSVALFKLITVLCLGLIAGKSGVIVHTSRGCCTFGRVTDNSHTCCFLVFMESIYWNMSVQNDKWYKYYPTPTVDTHTVERMAA